MKDQLSKLEKVKDTLTNIALSVDNLPITIDSHNVGDLIEEAWDNVWQAIRIIRKIERNKAIELTETGE